MTSIKSVADWMSQREMTLEQMVDASGLDQKVIDAILQGRYTPSPKQRQRVAAALGVKPDDIAWGHVNHVEHVQGHGPQFGRSP